MSLALLLGVYLPACLLLHEAGHMVSGRLLGYPVRLVLSRRGIGTRIMFGDDPTIAADPATLNQKHLIITQLAGPLASLLAAAVAWSVGLEWLAFSSIEVAVVNLLPLPHSDGRRAAAAVHRILGGTA